ncbi:MAG TPA: NADPH:quinone oxidoreductase family protein [Acidimicrobiales bacterium]|nr:NADPH:quinone oxidoreductase family protein [Acidimicrobiales bacterium]
MQAVVCHEFGPPENLKREEVPDPVAGPGQVLIDVHASAANFPDVLMLADQYQFKPGLPFIPGGEVAGVVSALGEGVEDGPAGLTLGGRVMALTGTGGFAEKVAVPIRNVFAIPEGMDMAVASGFPTAYGTTYHALVDRGALQPGETLLVLGAAGGVGMAAVELGAALGAVVIAGASSPEKLAACVEHGASMTIDYSKEDLRARVKELTAGQGADVVYDPVGADLAEPAFRSIAWNGRFLVIGFAGGHIPKLAMNLPLLKAASVVGVYWGAFAGRESESNRANMDALGRLFQEGKLRPVVSAVYPLERAAAALEDLGQRRAVGKVVVVTETGAQEGRVGAR